jgi:hypothetical protein
LCASSFVLNYSIRHQYSRIREEKKVNHNGAMGFVHSKSKLSRQDNTEMILGVECAYLPGLQWNDERVVQPIQAAVRPAAMRPLQRSRYFIRAALVAVLLSCALIVVHHGEWLVG